MFTHATSADSSCIRLRVQVLACPGYSFQGGEGLEVFGSHAPRGAFHVGEVHERHAAALEAGAAETAPVNAVGPGHDLVETDLLRRAGFPVMDRRPAAFEA